MVSNKLQTKKQDKEYPAKKLRNLTHKIESQACRRR